MINRTFLITPVILCKLFINSHSQSAGENKYLDYAERAVEVLQENWFDNKWECGTNFTNPWHLENIWNAFNTAEVLIDYSTISGKKDLIAVIEKFVSNNCAFEDAKYAGYDDAQWTAITLIKAYRLTNKKEYLNKAEEIWDYIAVNSWDTTHCGGGLWWNIEKTYKNAITNELFLMLSSMLYLETKEEKYKSWALKEWQWFVSSGLIAENNDDGKIKNLINDGLDKNCRNSGKQIWTYNQGVILGGLINLWEITSEIIYLEKAIAIAETTIDNLSENGILSERVNFPLNTDQQQFKGIFVRYLAFLTVTLPQNFKREKEIFKKFILYNADAVWNSAKDRKISAYWNDTADQKSICNAITQTAGIDLYNAAAIVSLPRNKIIDVLRFYK